MQKKKIMLLFLFPFFLIISCKKDNIQTHSRENYQCPMKCEADKIYTKTGICPICGMELKKMNKDSVGFSEKQGAINSIFTIKGKWKTEENKMIRLSVFKGKVLVIVMIYTSCKAACPRLISDMKNIESKIPDKLINKINFVFVSIDPKNDTPEQLKKFAIKNNLDDEQWTFLQGSARATKELATALAIQYKRISLLDIAHSSIISVFDKKAELVHQQEGIGVSNNETIERIIELAKQERIKF